MSISYLLQMEAYFAKILQLLIVVIVRNYLVENYFQVQYKLSLLNSMVGCIMHNWLVYSKWYSTMKWISQIQIPRIGYVSYSFKSGNCPRIISTAQNKFSLEITLFRDVTPYYLLHKYQCFRKKKTCYLQLQRRDPGHKQSFIKYVDKICGHNVRQLHKIAQAEMFLACILEVPSSNLGMDTNYPMILCGCPWTFQSNTMALLKIGHNHFLQHILKFIIHLLTHHLILYNLSYWEQHKINHK
jgi:hypothetical protein